MKMAKKSLMTMEFGDGAWCVTDKELKQQDFIPFEFRVRSV